jgi:hypothetical protein
MVVRVRFPLLVLFEVEMGLKHDTAKVVKNRIVISATTNEDNLIAKLVHKVNIKDSVVVAKIAGE